MGDTGNIRYNKKTLLYLIQAKAKQVFSSRSFFNLEIQNSILRQKPVRIALLTIGCFLILVWQYFFYVNTPNMDKRYRIERSSGLCNQAEFIYFYYYLGLLPVAVLNEQFVYSKKGAKQIFEKYADYLVTELRYCVRSGDLGQILLYLPDVFLKGAPDNRGRVAKEDFKDDNLFQQLIELKVIKKDKNNPDYAFFNYWRIPKKDFRDNNLVQKLLKGKVIHLDRYKRDHVNFDDIINNENLLLERLKQLGINKIETELILDILKQNFVFVNNGYLYKYYYLQAKENSERYFQINLALIKENFDLSDHDVAKVLELWKRSHLSVRPSHRFVFVSGLVVLFIAFWWIQQPILGILIVLLMGSNPFQLYEVYFHENVFGWPISTFLIVLALHLPLLTNRRLSKYYLWTIPVLTGTFLGTVRQIRSEPVVLIVSAAFSYLLISRIKWRIKGALLFLLLLSFFVSQHLWKAYFNHKIDEATQKVQAVGGQPYIGPHQQHHPFWHPVFVGLGDFGGKYGYTAWSDQVAVNYALPILEEKYNVQLPIEWVKYGNRRWNEDKKYGNTYWQLPHYGKVIRDKVIQDITHDPLWYFTVLLRRGWRIISETTPVCISLGKWCINIPMHGIFLIPILVILIATKNWMLVKLICFTFPLSFTAFLIYSGGKTTYYSCFHLVVTAILGAWSVEGMLWWYKTER